MNANAFLHIFFRHVLSFDNCNFTISLFLDKKRGRSLLRGIRGDHGRSATGPATEVSGGGIGTAWTDDRGRTTARDPT